MQASFQYFECEACKEGVYYADIDGAERCLECGMRGDNDAYVLWIRATTGE